MSRPESLRELADAAIGPVHGEYLRPWMSRGDPVLARVFLVGASPATAFPSAAVGREDYLDALLAGGDRLRDLYLSLRAGVPSPTRGNIERLVALLARHDVTQVLETNIWTMPKRDLASLRAADRDAAMASGRTVVQLMAVLEPRVVIVHGAEATRGLGRLLGRQLRSAPVDAPVVWERGRPTIVTIPSLGPPRANAWLPSADTALREMARAIRATLTE